MLVDLPKDITAGTLARPIRGGFESRVPGRKGVVDGEPLAYVMEAMFRAAKLVNNARKPILYVGQGLNSSLSWYNNNRYKLVNSVCN